MTHTTVNVNNVIERCKSLVGARSDAELAKALGVPRTTVSNWRQRKSGAVIEHAIQLAQRHGQDLGWMLLGERRTVQDPKRQAAAFNIALREALQTISFLMCGDNAVIDRVSDALAKRRAEVDAVSLGELQDVIRIALTEAGQ